MDFLVVNAYDNYVEAHIVKGRLEEEGIDSWLKDENTVTIDPILTNAVGGIKLMVAASQAERALALIRQFKAEKQNLNPCPKCDSRNIELVTTPRKPGNWFSVFIGLFVSSYAPPVEQVYHCFDCGNEYHYKSEETAP